MVSIYYRTYKQLNIFVENCLVENKFIALFFFYVRIFYDIYYKEYEYLYTIKQINKIK